MFVHSNEWKYLHQGELVPWTCCCTSESRIQSFHFYNNRPNRRRQDTVTLVEIMKHRCGHTHQQAYAHTLTLPISNSRQAITITCGDTERKDYDQYLNLAPPKNTVSVQSVMFHLCEAAVEKTETPSDEERNDSRTASTFSRPTGFMQTSDHFWSHVSLPLPHLPSFPLITQE